MASYGEDEDGDADGDDEKAETGEEMMVFGGDENDREDVGGLWR